MRKTIFTLNVNDYAPEVRAMTYPLLRYYARKIGAEFREITERKFPAWPVVYEKLQIHELGKGSDWIIFFDADTLVHPECIDFTCFLDAETCAHNGQDMAALRFRYDEHFIKDGRNIGTCGWCTIAPRVCLDLWKPTEQSLAEVLDCCRLTVPEMNCGLMDDGHLVDDYVMSRNLARFGFKHTTIKEVLPKIGLPDADFFWHVYTIGIDEKVRQMKEVIRKWQIPSEIMNA